MNGAILYASRYGSTSQYADWIGEATGLPVFEIGTDEADPARYDFVVLGTPILYYKPLARSWIKRHRAALMARPLILFTVSGAGPGAKLDGWLAKSLPGDVLAHADHVALRGRQDPRELRGFDRLMLIIAGKMNRDRKAGSEEMHGFDYMDKASIGPIVEKIGRLRAVPGTPAGT